jgi:putative zinc finger/helix-turn-helix YgiT family protein
MKSRIQCPECGDAYLRRQMATVTGSRKGESFPVDVEALVCPKCDFTTVPRERAADFALRVANAYRKKHGLLTSLDLKDIRAQLRMTQKQFYGKFVPVGEASGKRWELGEIQSRAMDRLIRYEVAHRKASAGAPREKYGRWGGFEQLQDKTAIQLYKKQCDATSGMPHGPPFGWTIASRAIQLMVWKYWNDNFAGTQRDRSSS